MPYIQTRDRTRLFYTDGGAGSPMVFVASAWLDSRMWEFQIPYLVGHGFRCIAYDRRGHGRSDSSWDGYDYDTLADDLGTLLDHLAAHGLFLTHADRFNADFLAFAGVPQSRAVRTLLRARMEYRNGLDTTPSSETIAPGES